jgi:polysaccharide export outer membrane protein
MIAFMMQSCKLKERIVYLNKHSIDSSSIISQSQIKLKEDDYISVYVSDLDNETVSLFNSKLLTPNSEDYGYLIDSNGEINFPLVGKIYVRGLTISESEVTIADKLRQYLNNPIVQVRITNFKVTIIGDVNKPGTFYLKSQRISIFDVIGLAGDLKIKGIRQNVLVLREENGQKIEYRVDLTSKSVKNSPVYYLQQNDLVYVEPNINSRLESTFFKSNGQFIVSAFAPILSIIILFRQ